MLIVVFLNNRVINMFACEKYFSWMHHLVWHKTFMSEKHRCLCLWEAWFVVIQSCRMLRTSKCIFFQTNESNEQRRRRHMLKIIIINDCAEKIGSTVIVSSVFSFLHSIVILKIKKTWRLFGSYVFMLMFIEKRHPACDHRCIAKVWLCQQACSLWFERCSFNI